MHKWQLAAAKISILLMLTGCTNTKLLTDPKTFWPDLPDVPPVENIELKSVKFELPTTKSFVGLDQENWLNFQYNWQAIKTLNQLYKDRIDQVNIQRQQWRELNKEQNAQSNPIK